MIPEEGPSFEEARAILTKKPFLREAEEIRRLAWFLSSDKGFLHQLRSDLAESICKWIGFQRLEEGMTLIREGEMGNVMYIVLRGHCKVFRKKKSQENGQHADQEARESSDLSDVGSHVGWVSEGEAIGELALVSARKRSNSTVIAGESGVDLITLERSTFNHFADRSRHNGHALHVVQSLRAACCRRILQISPNLRTEDDIEALTELTNGLEAFSRLPGDVCKKLARGMMHIYMPPGAVLFEEDSPGDSMFVIVSGRCIVRSKPLQDAPEEVDEIDKIACEKLNMTMTASGPASTSPKETSEKVEVPAAKSEDSSVGEGNDTLNQPERKNNSQYWISRYFQQARGTIQAQDPSSGAGNGLSPLAAVCAAKWRQTIKDRKEEQGGEEESKEELTGMAALLGPAAAKMWRERTFGNRSTRNAEIRNAQDRRFSTSGTISDRSQAQSNSHRSSTTGNDHESLPGKPMRTTEGGESTFTDFTSTTCSQGCSNENEQTAACEETNPEPQVTSLYDPNKQALAELGSSNPANVSKELLAEVGNRANLSRVLHDVAKQIQFNGPPKRLTRKDSRKLTKLVNRKLLGGASKRGFGQSQQIDRAVHLSENGPRDDETDVHTEYGLSDWRSSIDMSETVDTMSIGTFETHSDLEEEFNNDDAANEQGPPECRQRNHAYKNLMGRHSWHGAGASDSDAESEAGENEKLDPEKKYGKVVRTLGAGESFGELALLQRRARRTATVTSSESGDTVGGAHQGGVHLIRITRAYYDMAVRSIQARQLEELLDFLKRIPAFRRLPRDKMTSLAIFCRPEVVEKGTVVSREGDPVDRVFLVREGEVTQYTSMKRKLTRTTSEPINDIPFLSSRSRASIQGKSLSRGPSNRTLLRQLSAPTRLDKDYADEDQLSLAESTGEEHINPVSASKDKRPLTKTDELRRQSEMMPLMVLAGGEIFGEAVFGYTDSVTVSPDHGNGEGDTDLHDPEPTERHTTSVVATQKSEILTVTATDLRRFGRKVQQELKEFATKRRDFQQQRKKTLQVTNRDMAELFTARSETRGLQGDSMETDAALSARDGARQPSKEESVSKPNIPKPRRRSRTPVAKMDAVKKAGIAWLMEDIQNLTYSTCAPRQKVKRESKIVGVGPTWGASNHRHDQHGILDYRRHGGVPQFRPPSRDNSTFGYADSKPPSARSGASSIQRQEPLPLDEFSKIEKAFRARLAVKERMMGYPRHQQHNRRASENLSASSHPAPHETRNRSTENAESGSVTPWGSQSARKWEGSEGDDGHLPAVIRNAMKSAASSTTRSHPDTLSDAMLDRMQSPRSCSPRSRTQMRGEAGESEFDKMVSPLGVA